MSTLLKSVKLGDEVVVNSDGPATNKSPTQLKAVGLELGMKNVICSSCGARVQIASHAAPLWAWKRSAPAASTNAKKLPPRSKS